jgi:hypothetical protein
MSYEQSKHQLWIDRISIPADKGMNTWTWQRLYRDGIREPNYPVPTVPNVFEWDYSLGIMLYNIPPITDEEWELEEQEWEHYLDSLD